MTTMTLVAGAPPRDRLEWTAVAGLLGFVAALQLSIAAAGICLALTLACWAGTLVLGQERWEAPRFFWPLLVYAAWTLVSAAFSPDPRTSFIDSKQLVLFLLVPAVYKLARGNRALTVFNVIITVGAASAILGIVQYGMFNYDHLGQRPQGTLGALHDLLGSAGAGDLRGGGAAALRRQARDVGGHRHACARRRHRADVHAQRVGRRGAGRRAAVHPEGFPAARDPASRRRPVPPARARQIVGRFYSIFDLHDPTNRDRLAMMHEGRTMIEAHPLTGVGPNMVERLYVQFRDPDAVAKVNPHLHNVPMQIAAERGLPALAIWIWFLVVAATDLWRKLASSRHQFLAAGGLAAIAGMLGAGLFEHNFGDSEFLMLFLVMLTLPFAADRTDLP